MGTMAMGTGLDAKLTVKGDAMDTSSIDRRTSLKNVDSSVTKYTFMPVNATSISSDQKQINIERRDNLNPLKRDVEKVEINLRTIVSMDQEPMHFM